VLPDAGGCSLADPGLLAMRNCSFTRAVELESIFGKDEGHLLVTQLPNTGCGSSRRPGSRRKSSEEIDLRIMTGAAQQSSVVTKIYIA
jgi:hypothetical protein